MSCFAIFLIFPTLLTLVTAQQLPQLTFGGENKPIIDNERVAVWDHVWGAGKPAPPHRRDAVIVYLPPSAAAGKVVFWTAGASQPDERGRSIVIDLKDRAVVPLANKSGYPTAFPRPGQLTKLLDNSKVVVWDFAWTSGQATPMHFHDKDVVVVYLEDGALKSTTPDGKSTTNEFTIGTVRFNARDRVHTESLVKGKGRAIITELK